MKKILLLLGLLTITSLLLAACSPDPAPSETPSSIAQSSGIIAEGRVFPVNFMDQSFSRPGQIAEVLVQDGEEVQTGQVLAKLASSPEAQLALFRAQQEALAAQQALDALQANAQVNLTQGKLAVLAAQDQLEAARDLYAEDASAMQKANLAAVQALLDQAEQAQAKLEAGEGIDPDVLAAAQARLLSADAALTSAQAAIDALELKASMAGTVIDLTLQAGQWISAGQPVITLADLSRWVIETNNLTEYEVVDITLGQKVDLFFDALPDLTLKGEISQINTRYEEKRGDITYTVTIALAEADPALRWGMTASVQFIP